jgi:hypothetical protein
MTVVLFFSNNCSHSIKFIEILKKSGEETSFSKFVCVDKVNGKRPQEVASFGITEVPTVVADGSKKVGAEAFNWLASKMIGPKKAEKPKETKQAKPVAKVISGIQSGSMFDEYERVVGLNTNNSIYGDSPFPPEGKIEREDFFVMTDDNLAGKSDVPSDENSNNPSQLDQDYAKFLEERNKLS